MAQGLGELKASGEMGRDRRQRKGVGRFAGENMLIRFISPLKRDVSLFISVFIIRNSKSQTPNSQVSFLTGE